MAEKSLVEYAFDVLSSRNEQVKFRVLFEEVAKLAGLDMADPSIKSKMSKLYTQLSLDGRFVTLTDNKWDLRANHKYEDVHIDMEDAYSDDYEADADKEEQELDKEERGEVSEELEDGSEEGSSEAEEM